MKLLSCLCLILCIKDVFLQINCYRCPTSSRITKEYFLTNNCSFLQGRKSYKCCVPATAPFACKFRRKRSDTPSFRFFLQSYPFPSSNNFLANPLEHSLNNEESNSFPQNQFGNNVHLQENRPSGVSNIFSQQRNNTHYLNNIAYQLDNPQFQQNQPDQPLNNFFYQFDNKNYLNNIAQPLNIAQQNSQQPNNFFRQNNFRNFLQSSPFGGGNTSLFRQNIPSLNFSFLTTKPTTVKVDAEESFHSEHITVRTPEMEVIKLAPIKRSLNTNIEMPLHDIHKHDNFNLLPSTKECGLHENTDRIFGGKDALIGEFPWMSLLEYSFNGRNIGFKCGGFLINNRYVITAAHCIVGRSITSQENLFRIRLGEHDINTKIDCDDKNDCNNLPINVEVEEIILHHGYHEMDKNIHNDIALVRLNWKISYTDFVKPICLPVNGERTNPGENMTIAGWGTKNKDTPSHVKQTASIPYINDAECKELWKDVVHINENQFCAGGKSMANSCKGDSGGPIMSTFSQSEHWYVEGIVSFGKTPCGGKPFPSAYTRVSSYLSWILDNIKA